MRNLPLFALAVLAACHDGSPPAPPDNGFGEMLPETIADFEAICRDVYAIPVRHELSGSMQFSVKWSGRTVDDVDGFRCVRTGLARPHPCVLGEILTDKHTHRLIDLAFEAPIAESARLLDLARPMLDEKQRAALDELVRSQTGASDSKWSEGSTEVVWDTDDYAGECAMIFLRSDAPPRGTAPR